MIFKSSYFILFTLLAPLALAFICPNGARIRREDGDGETETEATEAQAETETEAETEAPVTETETETSVTEAKPVETAEDEVVETEEEMAVTELPKQSGGSDGIFAGVDRTELTTPIKWVKEAIEVHNNLRELHDSPPLVFNKTLSDISQHWANHLAETGKKDHNPKRGELGENLYWSSNSIVLDLNASTPVTGWYNEIHDYDFVKTDSKDKKKPVLHFTQLVWKETKEIGIAFATATKPVNDMYTTYVVANYHPRGNWGDFIVNVVPVNEKFKDKVPKPKPTDEPGKPTPKSKTPTPKSKEDPNTGVRSYESSLSLFLGCTVALFLVY